MADLIVTILLLLALSRGLGEVFERLRQSPMVGEILAGVILGPYVLGAAVLDLETRGALQAVADLGVFLLVFLAGLEMDIDEVAHSIRGRGVAVGVFAFTIPFLAGFGLGNAMALPLEGSLFLALILGLTALPVTVRILMDLGLNESPLGKVVISAAVLSEVLALTLLGVIITFQSHAPASLEEAVVLGAITLIKTVLLISIVLTFVQALRLSRGVIPGAHSRFRRFLNVLRGRESLFALSVLFVLAFAGASQVLGLHFVVGTFFGGLLLGPRVLGRFNYEQVTKTASAVGFGFLAPIFFGFIGLQLVPDAILLSPALSALVIGASFSTKLLAGYAGARMAGHSGNEALFLGVGLTLHGVLELVLATLALQMGAFDTALFSVVVLNSIISTIVAPPLLRAFAARVRSRPPAASPEGGPVVPEAARARALYAPLPGAPVIIIGGGRVAGELARSVGPCTVLEREAERARLLAEGLSEAKIVIGDAEREADLVRAGVGSGAIVLAATDDDIVNEYVVRVSKRLGARRVISRMENAASGPSMLRAGADAVVNSSEQTAAAILLDLYPPDASMVEVLVVPGAPAVGVPLGLLKLPRGAAVRSVSRRGRVHVPTPDLTLEPRDELIVSGPPKVLQQVREIIMGPAHDGASLNVVAVAPLSSGLSTLARELGPMVAASAGTLMLALPLGAPRGIREREAELEFPAVGITPKFLHGYSSDPSDLEDALQQARGPRVTLDEGARNGEGPAVSSPPWVVALSKEGIGRAAGQVRPRSLLSHPIILGVPLYIARQGAPPRTVNALIDGSEGADRAGVFACSFARLAGARLRLLVVRYEDEAEPLEQAAYLESYARNVGLGAIEREDISHPSAPAVERALKAAGGLVIVPALPRAVGLRFVAQMMSGGDVSVALV